MWLFFGAKNKLPRIIDWVNNDTDKLYSVLVQNSICQDHYVFTFTNEGYNVTPKAFHYIKKDSPVDWFKEQFASWNENYAPALAEIGTRRGTAFSFNMIQAEKLFNFDQ